MDSYSTIQLAFYILSPIGTFLAVAVAYYALHRQFKPLIIVYYEPNLDRSSVIDLVIKNIGNGTARNINLSNPIPYCRFGIETPSLKDKNNYLNTTIPVLTPNRELRFMGGQFSGLDSALQDTTVNVEYVFNSPLCPNKKAIDTSVLDIKHLAEVVSNDSAEQVLIDAFKGQNSTVFDQINKSLTDINLSLKQMKS